MSYRKATEQDILATEAWVDSSLRKLSALRNYLTRMERVERCGSKAERRSASKALELAETMGMDMFIESMTNYFLEKKHGLLTSRDTGIVVLDHTDERLES